MSLTAFIMARRQSPGLDGDSFIRGGSIAGRQQMRNDNVWRRRVIFHIQGPA
jgi:hypothetical protein